MLRGIWTRRSRGPALGSWTWGPGLHLYSSIKPTSVCLLLLRERCNEGCLALVPWLYGWTDCEQWLYCWSKKGSFPSWSLKPRVMAYILCSPPPPHLSRLQLQDRIRIVPLDITSGISPLPMFLGWGSWIEEFLVGEALQKWGKGFPVSISVDQWTISD